MSSSGWFVGAEAAARYARFRPKVQGIVREWLAEVGPDPRFGRALDIGCGTGDSLTPLTELADEAIGIDASPAMLALAREQGLTVHEYRYDAVPPGLGRFDLLTIGMALHWFDPDRARAAFAALSTDHAWWLAYNFAFTGHADDDAFNNWLRTEYLRRFPSPPREHRAAAALDDGARVRLVAADKGVLPLGFSRTELIGYLTTQSNIEAAVRAGASYAEIEAWLDTHIPRGEESADHPFRYAWSYQLFTYTRNPGDA